MRERAKKTTRRQFSTEGTKARAKQKSRRGGTVYTLPDGFDLFKVTKPGTYRLDILPYIVEIPTDFAKVGDLHWERTIFVHFNVGAEQRARLCPKTIGKKCPICEAVETMRNNPNIDDAEVRAMCAKERQLFYIIEPRNADRGIQIYEASYHNFGKAIDRRIFQSEEEDDNELNVSNFADPEDGLTIKAYFEEATIGGGNKFLKCETLDFITRKTQYDMATIEELPSLDSLIIVPSYKDLKSEYEGIEAKNEDVDEEDEDEEDEDDEDDEDEDEDEEESEDDNDDD